MIDLNKIPAHILADLRERMTDEAIASSDAFALFHEYCEWHGLLGWSHRLTGVFDSLQKATIGPATQAKRVCANCGLTWGAHGQDGACPESEGGDFPENGTTFEDSGESYEVPAGQRAVPRRRVLELLAQTETDLDAWYRSQIEDEVFNKDLQECREELFEIRMDETCPGDAWNRMAELLEDVTPEELLLPEPEPEFPTRLTMARSGRLVPFWETEVGGLFWARKRFWVRLDESAAKSVHDGVVARFEDDEVVELAEVRPC